MKLLMTILILGLSVKTFAADTKLIEYKDWRADKVEAHKVTGKASCVAKTTVKGTDTSLEVYAESAGEVEFVQPTVQIVTTDVAPALGVVLKMNPGGQEVPMTISLKETKTLQKEVMVDGTPTIEEVEQQIFIAKFKDKKSAIEWIRQKNTVEGKFFNAEGEIAKMNFSLGGSHKSVTTMMDTCL